MIAERDRAVIAEMCRTGMSLDVLKKSFPQFDSDEVEKIFIEQRGETIQDGFDIRISCNCS